MFSASMPPVAITTLHQLNEAVKRLVPSISGLSMSDFQTKGINLAIVNHVIAACPLTLYNGIKRTDIVQTLKPLLAARVNAHPITYTYDTHGDKHFAGGPAGTKFVGDKDTINTFLRTQIAPLVGRIRRDANGRAQTYYLTSAPNQYTNGEQMAIQVDYVVTPAEGITYHGYPRDVASYTLSHTLGGDDIPA